jgi:hypothetical protein
VSYTSAWIISNFYERFTPKLVEFLKLCATHAIEQLAQDFERISLLIESKEGNEKIVGMTNLREIHIKILALLGASYEKMYLCYRCLRNVGHKYVKRIWA